VGGVVTLLGVAGVVVPDIVIATGRYLVSPSGLYAAAAFRVGVGLVLILAARESRAQPRREALTLAISSLYLPS